MGPYQACNNLSSGLTQRVEAFRVSVDVSHRQAAYYVLSHTAQWPGIGFVPLFYCSSCDADNVTNGFTPRTASSRGPYYPFP